MAVSLLALLTTRNCAAVGPVAAESVAEVLAACVWVAVRRGHDRAWIALIEEIPRCCSPPGFAYAFAFCFKYFDLKRTD